MREEVARVRLREGQASTPDMLTKTYSSAMSMAATAVLDAWASGAAPPKGEPHLVPTEIVDAEGVVVGFVIYLVWGEIRSLGGKMPQERA